MKIRTYPNDYLILGIILLLSGFGLVMMYSASSIYAMNKFDNYLHFFIQQIKWLIIGSIIMLFISRLNYRVIKDLAYLLIVFSWIVLILGYFFKGNNPASRWLIIGGRSWLTTSDLARISLIIFTAYFIDKNKNSLNDWKFLIKRFTPVLSITLLLILFQPDTSTAITISLIIMVMLFIAKTNWGYLLSISLIGLLGLVIKIFTTP